MERSTKFLQGPLAHLPLKIDDFSKGASVYFLTHIHEDHLQSLHLSWNQGRIFCTPTTKRLLLLRFPGLSAALLNDIDVGQTMSVWLDEKDWHSNVTVTCVDARHCPGSCMFLFQHPSFGRFLHTGDFRYELGVELPVELNDIVSKSTNNDYCVYLDNTFGLLQSPSFPSRKLVVEALMDVIKLYPAHQKFVFVLRTNVGKEELPLAAAKVLKTKIFVSAGKYEKLAAYEDEEILTHFTCKEDELSECRIYCQSSTDNTEDMEAAFPKDDVCKIMATGWSGMKAYYALQSLVRNQNRNACLPEFLKVPYSLHSCREEIRQFVTRCGFQYIVPTVNITDADLSELEVPSQPWEQVISWPPSSSSSSSSSSSKSVVHEEKKENSSSLNNKPKNNPVASPTSHARRQWLKRERHSKSDEDDCGIEVIFRRQQTEIHEEWEEEEIKILQSMIQLRKDNKCMEHEKYRKQLRRSDQEIITKIVFMQHEVVIIDT